MGCGEREVCRCPPVSWALRPGESDAWWQYGVSAGRCGWLHQPGILLGYSLPSTAPVRKCEHPVCISLANVAGAAYSSCLHRQPVPFFFFFWCCRFSAPALWKPLQSIVSQKPRLCKLFFAHTGRNIGALIDSHCQIVIFSAQTLVAKQFKQWRKSLKPLLSLETLGWRHVVC